MPPQPAPRKKRLVRAGLLAAAGGYFAFVLLFELPLLPFTSSSTSSSSSLPIQHPRRRELEAAAAAFASPSSPARPSKPAFPAAAAPAPSSSSSPALPIFSSLLLLPRPNATATPFDAVASDAFAAAKPHLAHLDRVTLASATTSSHATPAASPPPRCPASISVHREQLPVELVGTKARGDDRDGKQAVLPDHPARGSRARARGSSLPPSARQSSSLCRNGRRGRESNGSSDDGPAAVHSVSLLSL